MPYHVEKRVLPYSPQILYDIVADVKRYPEFLPWILKARIIDPTPQGFIADLTAGYKLFQGTYRSEVILIAPQRIEIRYIKGPFKHLNNHWVFSPHGTGVMIDFFIEFEFQSSLFQRMVDAVFMEIVKKMITAFEERAKGVNFKSA